MGVDADGGEVEAGVAVVAAIAVEEATEATKVVTTAADMVDMVVVAVVVVTMVVEADTAVVEADTAGAEADTTVVVTHLHTAVVGEADENVAERAHVIVLSRLRLLKCAVRW